MSADVRLVEVIATLTLHGRCEVCGKRMRSTETFKGSTLEDVGAQVRARSASKRFWCSKHRITSGVARHASHVRRDASRVRRLTRSPRDPSLPISE